jgi:hypothetical protein
VALYLHSPNAPSWRGEEEIFTFTILISMHMSADVHCSFGFTTRLMYTFYRLGRGDRGGEKTT